MEAAVARYRRGEGGNPRLLRGYRKMALRLLRRWLRSGPAVGALPEKLREMLEDLERSGWPIDVAMVRSRLCLGRWGDCRQPVSPLVSD